MILNLTQHQGTPEQGVQEPANKAAVAELLTFETLPDAAEIELRAGMLASIAYELGAEAAMIGGAPFLMGPLERALKDMEIRPLYAFSRRESVEELLPGGEVKKTQVFKHLGFVKV